MSILVGLDGSAHSAATLTFAAEMADVMGSDVVVVHCRRESRRDASPVVKEFDVESSTWSDAFDKRGLRYRLVIVDSDPRHGLSSRAKSERAELVVVGTRGRGGFRGLRLGGTADYVVHHVECPVAIVPDAGGQVGGGVAVLGVDGSDANRHAGEWAVRAAENAGGRIEAVFVHDPMADSYPHPTIDNWHYHDQVETEDMVRDLTDTTDVVIDLRDVAGHVVTTLDAVANSIDAAYIVVGTRGRGSAGGRILGRPTLQLLHHAQRPVVVVPHGETAW